MEFIAVLIGFVLPMYIAYKIAEKRNRSKAKCLLVVLFFGWLGLLGLALILKTRDPESGFIK